MKKNLFIFTILCMSFGVTYAQTLVPIVSATAGSEQVTAGNTAAKAYDGSTGTRWVNNESTVATAWIEFDLGETPVVLSQMQAIFFRQFTSPARTYPIKIDVINDAETVTVFTGSTSTQTAENVYQIFDFSTNASGKKVKITMTDVNSSGSAITNGYLSIYEAKFYAPGISTSLNTDKKSEFNVYPNIVKAGAANVIISNIADKNVTVNVFDVRGQQVSAQNKNIEAGIVSLNLNKLAAGTYFVKTSGVTGINTAKLIIK